MRFLVEDFSALLCLLDGFRIAVPVFSYLETSKSVINCIIAAPDPGLPNDTKLSISRTIVNVLHTFQKFKYYMSTVILRFPVYKHYMY